MLRVHLRFTVGKSVPLGPLYLLPAFLFWGGGGWVGGGQTLYLTPYHPNLFLMLKGSHILVHIAMHIAYTGKNLVLASKK